MKKIWQSKTFWLNLLASVAVILDMAQVLRIPADVAAVLVAGLAAANLILRIWFTDQGIE